LDDQRQNLVLAAGVGEAGAKMKTEGHHIALNANSLVARAVRSGEIVSIDDVYQASDWLPNPLLPNTRSEMAVPIILEEQTVGVLDVQQDQIAGLDEGDANLLRSLANQVAVAIRNARLFAQVELALAEAHAVQERYLEQTWDKTKIMNRGGQYLYVQPNADPPGQDQLARLRQQAPIQDHPVMVGGNGDHSSNQALVAPVTLRDKMIGALQLPASRNGQAWTDDDLLIIQAVVDQLAQTAETLHLFEETHNRANRERIIREIVDKMQTATSLDKLIRIAAEELGERLAAGHVVVDLG
jgi:GAF domain-containing protein